MRNRPLCTVCLMIVLVICVGTVFGGERFVKELRPSEAERTLSQEDHITLTGRIYQKTEKQDYQVLYLKNNSIIYHQQSLKESKIVIYDEKKKKLDIGDIVIADGKIRFFENARNPGNFDMKLYYQSQGIHASVWAESVGKVKNNDSTLYEKIRNILYKFRCTWKKNLCNVMGEKDGNILSAMILGEKAQIDQEQKELYRVNGIGHILAISGVKTLNLVTTRGAKKPINWAFLWLHRGRIYIIKHRFCQKKIPFVLLSRPRGIT